MEYSKYDYSYMFFYSERPGTLAERKYEDDVPEETKMSALGAALKRITEITVQALSYSIAAVKTPDALVSEPEFITEWLQNCERTMFTRIRDHIISIKEQAELQPMQLKCTKCGHEYQQPITLDMSSFFESAS